MNYCYCDFLNLLTEKLAEGVISVKSAIVKPFEDPIFVELKTFDEYQQFLNQLKQLGYKQHHTAFIGGYVSRKIYARVIPYNGRFGKGVIVHLPTYLSTQYHLGTYFILED